MNNKMILAVGVLFMTTASLVGAQTPTTMSLPAQAGAGSAAAGTGIAQPGIIVRPVSPICDHAAPPIGCNYISTGESDSSGCSALKLVCPQSENNNDIVQFNNLSIQSISGSNLPAEIIATANDYYPVPMMDMKGGIPQAGAAPQAIPSQSGTATKCYTFKRMDSTAMAMSCPTVPATIPSSGTTSQSAPGTNPSTVSGQAGAMTMPLPAQAGRPPILSRIYRIEVGASTRLRLRDQGTASLADFSTGDQINIFGIYNKDGTIQALIVRDLSKPIEKNFVQLNNVTVLSISAASVPASIVVVQQPAYPCYDYGTNGGGTGRQFPCPMGLKSFSDNPNSASVQAPQSLMPILNTARKYIVNADAQTIFMNRTKAHISLSDIHLGDKLNVYGSTTGNGETIDADIVRDTTQPATAASVSGTVTQINQDGSFMIQADDGTTVTAEDPIRVGSRVKLTGLIDELQRLITQISQIVVQNNPQTQPPNPIPGVSIFSVSPLQGPIGTTITVNGSGFAKINTVYFGFGAIPNVVSSDGATLTFSIPESLSPLCYYSTPRCMIASQFTQPGVYPISVSNENGRSNEVKFIVTATTTPIPLNSGVSP